jgi:hypothetical protein
MWAEAQLEAVIMEAKASAPEKVRRKRRRE